MQQIINVIFEHYQVNIICLIIRIYFLCFKDEVDNPKSVEIDLTKEISPLQSPKWANYVVGVLALFLERTKPKKKLPFRILIATSVPIGGGLSSSASLEVAMCTFLELLYQSSSVNGQQLSKVDKALLCCKAEQTYANVPCGIMDQYTACLAEADHALLVDCRDNTSKSIPMKDKEVCVLVTNSNVRHELVAGTYAERVRHCQEAANILGKIKIIYFSLNLLEFCLFYFRS
jgi:galactokinase